MKIKLLMGILVILVLLTSCGTRDALQRGIGGQAEQKSSAYTGTKGITVSIEDPSQITVTPGDDIEFNVRVSNEGRYDTKAYFYLSGFDTNFLSYQTPTTSLNLKGKSGIGDVVIPGDWDIISFKSYSVSSIGQRFRQDTTVTTCFDYETELTMSSCIDANAQEDEAGCPASATESFSQGQGAPVAISSVSYSASRKGGDKVRVSYTLQFSQVDNENNAKIISKDKVQAACSGQRLDAYRDFNVIQLEEVKIGNINLKCPPGEAGNPPKLNLNYQSTLTCYADIDATSDYSTALYVKASYGFKKDVTKPILIQQTLG